MYDLCDDRQLGSIERWSEFSVDEVGVRPADMSQFQQQMPGNVLPMQPFIDTMHDTVINGVPTISSQVVSFWQGFGEMAKMAGQASGVLFSDRIGRK
jgi:hypothetical protein